MILLFHEHEAELKCNGDEVVILFSEVMFDKKNNISGENPDHIRFIYDKKRIFESWGYKVEILHSDKDYLDIFYHKLARSPRDTSRIGKTHGFPPAGICAIKRDCKLKPIKEWFRDCNSERIVQYIGIAADEDKRLVSMRKNKTETISLLEKYGLSEEDALELCLKYNMLSPLYNLSYRTVRGKTKYQSRSGCWFCANAKLCEARAIRQQYPDAWSKFVSLEDTPDLAYPKWNCYSSQTLHDVDKKLRYEDRQINLFELLSA